MIKNAYRRLARQFHPDLHPGDTAAAERFKEVLRRVRRVVRPASAGDVRPERTQPRPG
ncbi:DnaJ domain-containing protein [Nonomuraea lactucae]|uniref:DnaJ domain-containing protein n=1 Tax=Nonomuraea lactucae TaxID=2249762 RepID=UPI003B833CE9